MRILWKTILLRGPISAINLPLETIIPVRRHQPQRTASSIRALATRSYHLHEISHLCTPAQSRLRISTIPRVLISALTIPGLTFPFHSAANLVLSGLHASTLSVRLPGRALSMSSHPRNAQHTLTSTAIRTSQPVSMSSHLRSALQPLTSHGLPPCLLPFTPTFHGPHLPDRPPPVQHPPDPLQLRRWLLVQTRTGFNIPPHLVRHR